MITMDAAQELLFGEFPRAVGTPSQHFVHSEGEFDLWAETVVGDRNAYAGIAWHPPGGPSRCDKVSYDLDSLRKDSAFPEGYDADEKLAAMRTDPELAEAVLGEVCEDARALAERSQAEGIPVVGVFTGFGIHVHQLYQPAEEALAEKIGSTARRYAADLGLQSLDQTPVGDTERIMRVPNMLRVVDPKPGQRGELGDGEGERRSCEDCWTVPLTAAELAEVTPEWLLEAARTPRYPALEVPPRPERPELEIHQEFEQPEITPATPADPVEVPELGEDFGEEGLEWLLSEWLQMPCMVERLLSGNPPHEVRRNSAVLLFQIGFTPEEVEEIYARLGWPDFDREVTRSQLEQIYREGYADMSCRRIMELGLCTRTEEPAECPTFGWRGGEPEW